MMVMSKDGLVVVCAMPNCRNHAKPDKLPPRAMVNAEQEGYTIIHGSNASWLALCPVCAKVSGVSVQK